jgi:cobalt transporter subunit CbtB
MNTGEYAVIAIETGVADRATSRAIAGRLPALMTIVLGFAMVFTIGFARGTVVHNGAHDTRHANGFPCH